MANRDEIFEQALALPAVDRQILVELLEQSLGVDGYASPEIAAAWMQEVERRALAYERGETTAEDWRVVMARIRGRMRPRDANSP